MNRDLRNLILFTLILVALVLARRRPQPRRDQYVAPDVPSVAEGRSLIPTPQMATYQSHQDHPSTRGGRVIVDHAHTNNLEINDLVPLRNRLDVRGAAVETFEGAGLALSTQLRGALGLIVFAPTEAFTAEEREAVVDFVEDGGRLLLAADPTRPVSESDERTSTLSDALFPTSAVPAINSLANAFDVVYFDDYLYNLEDNAGNYRHVRFTTFDQVDQNARSLTHEIETLVLFATHSLDSEGIALLVGDANTQSPVRSGESDLAAATLNAEGRVLALGDLTFLTPPHHTVADNDLFLSHVADWLLAAERSRVELDDFPYLFEGPVDLVQISGEMVSPKLITRGGELQAFFDQAGLTLNVRAQATVKHDALLVGRFDDLEMVRDDLSAAGITFIFGPDDASPDLEESSELEESPEEEEMQGDENQPDFINVETLGTISTQGTTLFVLNRASSSAERDRVTLTVLAENEEQIADAIERLVTNDLSGCLPVGQGVTVCSTGEEAVVPPLDGESDNGAASIFILAFDNGAEGERTAASELEDILGSSYNVTVWSIAEDGFPESSDMEDYEAYVLDFGDYAFDPESLEELDALDSLESGGVMIIGSQPPPFFADTDYEPIEDLRAVDAEHPLTDGFNEDAVIPLLASESGVPAAVLNEADIGEEASIVLVRGPDSAASGTPALVTVTDDSDEVARVIVGSFAFYRLPEEARRTLALNAVKWLMGVSE